MALIETVAVPSVAAPTEPLIELRDVSKSYPTEGGQHVTILDALNLEVREGEMLALLGQSGSGKSTILRLMAGLADPTQGAVLCRGEPLEGINPLLSLVFQTFALYPWLTVEQNVAIGLMRRRLPRGETADEIERALELIGVTGYENAYPKQLSGGMRQRVGLARALVARPELLCMDEAFSALDVLTAENLRNEVIELWRGSRQAGIKSIFFVTHNIEEAVYMASRIVIMSSHPGRIKHVIPNTLPYPREPNSSGFAALVDQIRAAITSVAMPDEPAEAGAARVGVAGPVGVTVQAPPVRTRVETIPAVQVEEIVGLLEILEAAEEVIDVFELAAKIGKEFGQTIAIVKAAEMLGLVDTPKDEVRMTEVGWYFLAAPMTARKTLFKQAIMKLRLFRLIGERLAESPDGTIAANDLRDELATLLPYDQPSKLFDTLVSWGRYAEMLDYDEGAQVVKPREPEEDDEDETA